MDGGRREYNLSTNSAIDLTHLVKLSPRKSIQTHVQEETDGLSFPSPSVSPALVFGRAKPSITCFSRLSSFRRKSFSFHPASYPYI